MDPTLVVILLLYLLAVAAAIVFTKPVVIVPKPTRFGALQIRRNIMPDVLIYKVNAAPVVDGDVVVRELQLVVNGAEPVVREFGPAETDLGTVAVPQGANVVLKLVDVDDAGNRSEPAVAEFMATDTLPPQQPGLGVELVAERPEADA
jgi:hypothetical protein